MADLLRDSRRAIADPRVASALGADVVRTTGEPGDSLHRGSSACPPCGRLPQLAAAAGARGLLRVEGVGEGDGPPRADRAGRDHHLLGALSVGACRGLHPSYTPRPRLAVAGAAAAVAECGSDQRRDAPLPRADRRVPDPARRVRPRGGAARGAAASSFASPASATSGSWATRTGGWS